jgi:hypothetical protein
VASVFPDNSRQTGVALEETYRCLLWLMPTVEKFPKSYKFVLGDRIQVTAIGVLEGLVEATYTRNREKILSNVNLGIETLRFLIRLSADLKCMDRKRYEFAARSLNGMGRLVGGWIKSHRAAQA